LSFRLIPSREKIRSRVFQKDTRTRRNMRSKTISEFCKDHGLSRARLYGDWKLGIGPKYWLNGSRRRISEEAEAEWLKQRELAAQPDTDAQMRSDRRFLPDR
jgi:hypothetical protein